MIPTLRALAAVIRHAQGVKAGYTTNRAHETKETMTAFLALVLARSMTWVTVTILANSIQYLRYYRMYSNIYYACISCHVFLPDSTSPNHSDSA